MSYLGEGPMLMDPTPMLSGPLLYTMQESWMAGSILHRKGSHAPWPDPLEGAVASPAQHLS